MIYIYTPIRHLIPSSPSSFEPHIALDHGVFSVAGGEGFQLVQFWAHQQEGHGSREIQRLHTISATKSGLLFQWWEGHKNLQGWGIQQQPKAEFWSHICHVSYYVFPLFYGFWGRITILLGPFFSPAQGLRQRFGHWLWNLGRLLPQVWVQHDAAEATAVGPDMTGP